MRAHRERCNLHFHCGLVLNSISADEWGIECLKTEGGVKELVKELITHRWAHLEGTWKALYNLIADMGWDAFVEFLLQNKNFISGLLKLKDTADEKETQQEAQKLLRACLSNCTIETNKGNMKKLVPQDI